MEARLPFHHSGIAALVMTYLSDTQLRVLRNPSGHTLSHAESAFGPMRRPDGSVSLCNAPSHRKGSRSSVVSAALTYLQMGDGRLLSNECYTTEPRRQCRNTAVAKWWDQTNGCSRAVGVVDTPNRALVGSFRARLMWVRCCGPIQAATDVTLRRAWLRSGSWRRSRWS